jgi:hypothetical protein
MFSEHLGTFGGKSVVDFQLGGGFESPERNVPRLRVEYDAEETAVDLLRDLLATGVADRLTGLVIGAWSGEMYDVAPTDIIAAMVAAADQLPSLAALFLGDVTYEENEISWIHQTDLSPLWEAFPRLEIFGARGSQGLSLGKLHHDRLTSFTIESGGLPRSVVQEVGKSQLPELEHLELYLGTSNYGGDATIDDLEPILAGQLFPKLKYLGLRDSEIADDVAKAVAKAPVLERIEVLDLSLGTLGDEGAKALLESPAVKQLKKLDLRHHYMSDKIMRRFSALGVVVDVSEAAGEGEADDRYVSVGE